jgi:septum formation topological specificity factor MinE
VTVDLDRIQVHLDKDGDMDILELNIILPDKQPVQQKVAVHS